MPGLKNYKKYLKSRQKGTLRCLKGPWASLSTTWKSDTEKGDLYILLYSKKSARSRNYVATNIHSIWYFIILPTLLTVSVSLHLASCIQLVLSRVRSQWCYWRFCSLNISYLMCLLKVFRNELTCQVWRHLFTNYFNRVWSRLWFHIHVYVEAQNIINKWAVTLYCWTHHCIHCLHTGVLTAS